MDTRLLNILKCYPLFDWTSAITEIVQIQGGLSEALVFKVKTKHGDFALRRWPASFPTLRLEGIHSVLRFVREKGLAIFPKLIADQFGRTIHRVEDTNWELSEWIAGESLANWPPSEPQLIEAFQVIAKLHLQVANFQSSSEDSLPDGSIIAKVGSAPGITKRLEFLHRICNPDFQASIQSRRQEIDPALAQLAVTLERGIRELSQPMLRELELATSWRVLIIPAIRDLQAEHVLFHNGRLSGIVDYGSMRQDSIAADLARIGEGWRESNPESWSVALDAYQKIRPLDEKELELINIYDRSSRLLGPANWIDWIFNENRHFEIMPKLQNRWRTLQSRLQQLIDQKNGFLTH